MSETDTTAEQCRAVVYRRDTYRYSGHGGSGFSMHYDRDQCRRKARQDGLCWQHIALQQRGHYISRW